MTPREKFRERADEYVLGLLEPAEEARLAEEMERDEALRRAVAESRGRFVELDLAARAEPVPETLWSRIEARLHDPGAGQAHEDGPEPRDADPTSMRVANDNSDGRRWRRRGIAAIAASVALAILLAWSLTTRPEPQVIAVLLDQDGAPLALVQDFGSSRATVTPLTDIAVPPGKTLQVWTKPSDEIGPVSLGLLPEPVTASLRGPELPGPRENQLYEITIEAAGGSPTGLPTGPIVAKGFANAPR